MAPPEWVYRRKTMNESNRDGALHFVLNFLPHSGCLLQIAVKRPVTIQLFRGPELRSIGKPVLVLLFPSLLTIPLARQGSLDATLFARLQVVGVTLDFLNDVLLLYLPFKPA
jgi:hypothetical protein